MRGTVLEETGSDAGLSLVGFVEDKENRGRTLLLAEGKLSKSQGDLGARTGQKAITIMENLDQSDYHNGKP